MDELNENTSTKVDVKNDKSKNNSLINQNYLNVKQLSAYSGFSVKYIYKLTHLNKIPFYKPSGGKLLFSIAEIEKWISESRFSTKEEIENQALIYSLKKSA